MSRLGWNNYACQNIIVNINKRLKLLFLDSIFNIVNTVTPQSFLFIDSNNSSKGSLCSRVGWFEGLLSHEMAHMIHISRADLDLFIPKTNAIPGLQVYTSPKRHL